MDNISDSYTNNFWVIQRIGFLTIVRREVRRFLRLWIQTIMPPMITMGLYFLIFGRVLGGYIGSIDGFSYAEFITPGIIILAMLNNAYANITASVFLEKFQHSIDELLYAPLHKFIVVLGIVLGGILRGLVVGVGVGVVAAFFVPVHPVHWGMLLLVILISMLFITLLAFLNALYAKHFDDISFVPAFILLPLIYLGGVFFPLSRLTGIWHTISWYNPIAYMIDATRYCMLGHGNVHNLLPTLLFLSSGCVVLYAVIWYLFAGHKGVRLS